MALQQQQQQAAQHRDRMLAYSTVGTPDYIAPEVLAVNSRQGYGQGESFVSQRVAMKQQPKLLKHLSKQAIHSALSLFFINRMTD